MDEVGATGAGGGAVPAGPDTFTPPAMAWAHRLQFRLGVLVGLCILPLAALLVVGHLSTRDGAFRSAGREAGRLARIAARNQEQDFARAQSLLEAVATAPQLREGSLPDRVLFLRELVGRSPGFLDIHLLRPDGTVEASALEPAVAAALCDGEAVARAVKSGLSAVGNFRATAEHGPTVHIVRPLEGPEGRPPLLLGATVGLGWLAQFQRALDLPGDSVLELLDPEGALLLRIPDAAGARKFPSPAFPRTIPDGDAPLVLADVDGVRKFFGLCPLVTGGSRQGFQVAIGIPESIIREPLDRALRLDLILTGTVLLLCLWAARILAHRLVLRRVNGLILATRRLASTDLLKLKARTRVCQDPGELGDLERSFDDMARAMEAAVIRSQARGER